jgi:hypothetical protein
VAVPAVVLQGSPVVKPKLLSRLAGASSRPFRVWFPAQSPVRIEYSRELLRLLLPRQDGEYSSGVLYGARAAGTLRVISARPRPDLEPVGIFAARWCGEVFLTEPDILRLETMDEELGSGDSIALVIAGGYGGFFVRELNGSMQTIQSYQEFPVRAPSVQPTRAARLLNLAAQATRLRLVSFLTFWKLASRLNFGVRAKLLNDATRVKKLMHATLDVATLAVSLRTKTRARLVNRLKHAKEWMPVAMVAAAVIILTGCVFPPPYFSRASPFTVQTRDGQLRIALTPGVLNPGARLQIVDGDERRSIAISPALTSVLYVPRTHDVHVTLVR